MSSLFPQWVISKPLCFERAKALLEASVASGQLTNGGPAKARLELFLKDFLVLDDDWSVVMAGSGTAALHALTAAHAIQSEKRLTWATSAFTFPSAVLGPLTASYIVDNEPGVGGPSLKALETIKDKIDGIIVTNIFGGLVNTKIYIEWAKRNGKLIIFDNAATPMSFVDGKSACCLGDGSIISFHETKPLGRGEGGCVVVPTSLAPAVERACNFGFGFGTPARKRHPEASNWRMSDIAAAFLHARLELIDRKTIEGGWETDKAISSYLKTSKHLSPLLALRPGERRFPSCLCVRTSTPVDIHMFQAITGIETKRYYVPLDSAKACPVAWRWYTSVVCLPYDYMQDAAFSISLLKRLEKFVAHASSPPPIFWSCGDLAKPTKATYNFGDWVTPFLFEKITGKKAKALPFRKNPKLKPRVTLGCGSIIHHTTWFPSTLVWGTGIIQPIVNVARKGSHTVAVRGPLTRSFLLSKGLACPQVYGDPGLLLPFVYTPQPPRERYRLGLVPHYIDYKQCLSFYPFSNRKALGIKLINVCRPIDQVVNDLTACDFIVSTSLHGVIVSHAYGVPAAWARISSKIQGGFTKYHDYYLSLVHYSLFSLPGDKDIQKHLRPLDWTAPVPLEALYEKVKAYPQPSLLPLAPSFRHLFDCCPFC